MDYGIVISSNYPLKIYSPHTYARELKPKTINSGVNFISFSRKKKFLMCEKRTVDLTLTDKQKNFEVEKNVVEI